jgi:tetratricopeptide (TPR) repeat protein
MSLNNYASHLSNAGQYEEALEHDRQSLEIYERLAQKNPDRFEPDYAMSLNNYASHLSDAGQYEEALDRIRQSLEIRKRLAQKNPDRFEPDYVMSLNNYASHLSNAGQYEEALPHARKALGIREQLAQKNLGRFADDLFSTTCLVRFLAWLCNENIGWEQPDLSQIMASIPSHRRPLMQLFEDFVEACEATDRAVRSEAFRRVLSSWDELSTANKTSGEPYWLCAAAWCAAFEPADLGESNWRDRWRQFANQRNGRLPRWMIDVAGRLGFEWPG